MYGDLALLILQSGGFEWIPKRTNGKWLRQVTGSTKKKLLSWDNNEQ